MPRQGALLDEGIGVMGTPWAEPRKWATLGYCACGCGKQVRASEYHSDCANECKCGCGGRARYAYKPGHRPEAVCVRCGKAFTALGGDAQYCNNCRRAVKAGGPVERDVSLSYSRRMQKAAPEGRRWCSGCEQYRLLKFFGPRGTGGGKDTGHYSRCKPCHKAQIRAAKWKKTFGITPEQYEQIKDLQGGRCAICQVASGATKALAVDHDHRHCGKGAGCPECIRGLLCSTCNNMLGFARDNPEVFRRAMEYLRDPPAQRTLLDT